MLSYAFQVLSEQGYKDIATESFENVADLCAAILIKGLSIQIKRGLNRDYIEQSDALSSPRGRIEISESIRQQTMRRNRLVCSYDEFSVNSYMNRILRTTMDLLMHADIAKSRKKELGKILRYFSDVDPLIISNINWKIQYNRNNRTYHLLISICWLVIKGLLQTNTDGSTRLMDFLDEQRMCRLYEKFILEYYRKEWPQIKASASQIPWALDDGIGDLLPVMQSDIMLYKGDTVLIIDAKYYARTMQSQYDVQTLHSNNLYQIFTNVKNKAEEDPGKTVSGMLLYAGTDEVLRPNTVYQMSGNQISVKTLDLNCDFAEIAGQLNEIVDSCFYIC